MDRLLNLILCYSIDKGFNMRLTKDIEVALADIFEMRDLGTGPYLELNDSGEPEFKFNVKYIWVATIQDFYKRDITLAGMSIVENDNKELFKGVLLIPSICGLSDSGDYQKGSIKPITIREKDMVASALRNFDLLPHKRATQTIKGNGSMPYRFSIETLLPYGGGYFSNSFVAEEESVKNIWKILIDTTKQFTRIYDDPQLNDFFANSPQGY